jgi:hypothetical protein
VSDALTPTVGGLALSPQTQVKDYSEVSWGGWLAARSHANGASSDSNGTPHPAILVTLGGTGR